MRLPAAVSRRLRHPLARALVAGALCVSAMLLANAVLRLALPGTDAMRMVRWLVSTAVLLAVYCTLFRADDGRAPAARWAWAAGALGLPAGVLAAGSIVLVLWALGCYRVLAVGDAAVLPFSLCLFLSAAALEEVVFRGVVYRIAAERLGLHRALALSAVIFGLLHLGNDHVSALGILSATGGGLLLALMFTATRRLWLPIAFHTGWNWAFASSGAVLSGMEGLPGFLRSRTSGPALLTGGAVGPEASVVTVGLVAVLALVVYLWVRARRMPDPRLSPGTPERTP